MQVAVRVWFGVVGWELVGVEERDVKKSIACVFS